MADRSTHAARVGETVTGRVRQVLPFGAFVALDDGLTGYIRRREMTLSANVDPRVVVAVGQTIQAMVIEPAEPGRNVELSLRRLEPNPWPAFAAHNHLGDVIPVTVKHVFADGVLVEHTPGVDGYIPLNELGAPVEALWVDDRTEAAILHLDKSHERLLLSVRRWAARLAEAEDMVDRLAGETRRVEVDDAGDSRPAAPTAPAALGGPILVVENQDEVRGPLLDWLGDAGYEAAGAASADEAQTLCAERRFALAIIDLDMPTVNGLQLIARLVDAGHDLPIAVMSVPDLIAREYERLRGLGVGLVYSKLSLAELLPDLHRLARGERPVLPPLVAAEAPAEVAGFRTLAATLREQRGAPQRLQLALDRLRQSLEADVAVVFRLDPAARAVTIMAQCGQPALPAADLHRLPESPVRDVIQEGEVLWWRRVSSDRGGRFRNLLALLAFESCIGLPLEAAGAVEHALFLFARRPDAFDAAGVREASAVAALLQSVLEGQALDERILAAGQMLLIGQLSSAIIHEVGNKGLPLETQINRARFLLARGGNDVQTRLATLLDDMADTYAGLQSATADLVQLKDADTEHRIDIHQALRQAERQLALEAQRQGVQIILPPDGALPPAVASPKRLHFALVNLMLNAIQWAGGPGEPRGRLRIDAATFECDSAPWLRLRFSDNGPGIHRDLWERVFGMGVTTRPGGSGLGLYIARSLVEAMNGRVFVEQSLMLLGTTFTVELPAVGES